MNAFAVLDASLVRFRRRFALWSVAQGCAVFAGVVLAAHALLVPLAGRAELAAAGYRSVSTALLGALLVLLAGLIAWPLWRLRAGRPARQLEVRTPELAGRVQTYVDRSSPGERRNPLLALLAEDAQGVLARFPPERALPGRWIALCFAGSAASLAALLWLGTSGPQSWQTGMRRLWSFGVGVPEPRLIVTPGDTAVTPGSDAAVRARAEGFDPAGLQIRAQFGKSDAWEAAAMERLPGGEFEFRFVGVREPIRYRVAAASVTSDAYRIDLVELPHIESSKLRYVFPDWAHREPLEVEPAGDVSAVVGTAVEVELQADRPLGAAVLVVNGVEQPLESQGASGRARFTVESAGTWFVAARHGEQRVPLSREYALRLVDDEPPQLRLLFPGRDRSASPIEEVTARLEARDDFHLESLAVRYSINGGPWQERALPAGGKLAKPEYVFALEELVAPRAAGAGTGAGAGDAPREGPGLHPGDVISYYALANDRRSSVRSDLFFIEVRPFDRRFLESQQNGGAGNAGGSPEDISARQRQIVLSIWNLVRERPEGARLSDPALRERAALLARLQGTLREQTTTLVERSRARGLVGGSDSPMQSFVANLEHAAEEMGDAARALEAQKLDAALPPGQRALQLLLRAEASLRDVSVSRQNAQNPGGGGGQRRDLAELYELEMDPAKNRYENPSRAGSAQNPEQDRKLRDAFSRLEELARRQEQLARQLARKPEPSLAQRWEQESLRRELEQLRRELAQAEASGDPSSAQLRERLGAATSALEEATRALEQQGERRDSEPANAARRSDEANRRMKDLVRALDEQRRAGEDGSAAELAQRAERLAERQRRSAENLERALSAGSAAADPKRLDSGELSQLQERELADEKGALRSELSSLEQGARSLAESGKQKSPELERALRGALDELSDQQLAERLSFAQELIQQGGAAFALTTEELLTQGLEDFRDRLQDAARIAARSAGDPAPDPADLLRSVQELRQRLAAAGARGAPAQPGENRAQPAGSRAAGQSSPPQSSPPQPDGSSPSQSDGAQSDPPQPGQAPQSASASGEADPSLPEGGAPPAPQGGRSGPRPAARATTESGALPSFQPGARPSFEPGSRSLDEIASDAAQLRGALQRAGVDGALLARLLALSRAASAARGSALGERAVELRAGLEDVELALRERLSNADAPGAIRPAAERVPADVERAPVAEYYRSLSSGSAGEPRAD